MKDVAAALGCNYKTLSGILSRDAVNAELLLQLAAFLNIDLAWMADLFGRHSTISSFAPLQISRMDSDFREQNYKTVLNRVDAHLRENPIGIADAKRELLKEYRQLYYLLDVLIPEDYVIRITSERGREKYYCYPTTDQDSLPGTTRGRPATRNTYEGNELLSRILAQRKEQLSHENSVL